MICRADQHYRVVRRGSGRGEVISALVCMLCDGPSPYRVDRETVRHTGSSGQARYNRMRARMVKHVHAQHRSPE